MYCVEALSNELLSGEYEQTIPIHCVTDEKSLCRSYLIPK